MREFQHVLLTRFNVRENPDDSRLVSNPVWLEERYQLFETFCFPSVSNQCCNNFRWLVFFDSSTPEVFRQRNEEYAQRFQSFEAIYLDEFSQSSVSKVLQNLSCCCREYLITTRLDNDDAISIDFVERIQENFRQQDAEVLNFTNGIIWYKGRTYRHKDLSNAFTSLVEKAGNIETVLARWHTKLAEIAPVHQIGGSPMWIQVVHGKNRKNRVRGRRVILESLYGRFHLTTQEPKPPAHSLNYFIDRIAFDHLRALRECIFGLARMLRR